MKKSDYKKKEGLFGEVYKIIRKIPKGKVATYGQIARMVGAKDARKIGWALHGNKDPNTPCHRVVNKDGRLAPNFAFGGSKVQKKLLITEQVSFKNDEYVDLEKHQWQPK